MELSARNQLSGRVSAIRTDGLMAEVTIDLGNGQSIVSVITRGSVDRLGLREGDRASAIIKATEVLIGK